MRESKRTRPPLAPRQIIIAIENFARPRYTKTSTSVIGKNFVKTSPGHGCGRGSIRLGAGWLPDPRPAHPLFGARDLDDLEDQGAESAYGPKGDARFYEGHMHFLRPTDEPPGHHGPRRRRLELCKAEKALQPQILNMQN